MSESTGSPHSWSPFALDAIGQTVPSSQARAGGSDQKDEMRHLSAPTGIHHVAPLARDLERTVRFYVDILGLCILEHTSEAGRPAPGRIWLGDGRRWFITITQSPDAQPGQLGVGTIHHIALAVASSDGLLKWKRWIQSHEIPVYGPYDQQAYQDLVLADPDGVLLEIATRGPGFEHTRDGDEVYTPPVESTAPYRNEEMIGAHTWLRPVTEIEPDMTLEGLHHVATIASSLPATDAFYQETLALPLVRKTLDSDDPEVERWYWGLEGGRPGALVASFPIAHPHQGGKAVYGRAGPGIALHYALELDSAGATADWATSLSAGGIEGMSIMDEAGRPAISIDDPDGQEIELVTAGSDAGKENR